MPATPNLFSDSKLIEAAVAFFADAESAVARTVDEVGDAMRDGEGWTSHSGVTFIQRPAVRGSQGALVEAILRKLGPRSGHEDEIRSTTWRGAAQWLTASERTPPEDAARLMLRTIGETADVTADLVIPNYTFRRAQGVSGARIGPVEILDSEIAKARVDALDNEHVRFPFLSATRQLRTLGDRREADVRGTAGQASAFDPLRTFRSTRVGHPALVSPTLADIPRTVRTARRGRRSTFDILARFMMLEAGVKRSKNGFWKRADLRGGGVFQALISRQLIVGVWEMPGPPKALQRPGDCPSPREEASSRLVFMRPS